MANVDLTSPETLARSVLEQAPTLGAVRTARQAQADRIRAEAIEKGPRSAIESLKVPAIPTSADVSTFLTENFYGSVTRNAAGEIQKVPAGAATPEGQRRTLVETRATALRQLLEDGYDAVPAGAAKTEMLKFATDTVLSWPDAKALYDSLPAATRAATFQTTVENMLKDPVTRKFIQTRFAGVMDKNKPFEQIKIELIEAQARVKERRDKISDKILANRIELLAVNSEVDTFRQGVAGKGLELRNLNNEVTTLTHSSSRYENFIASHESLKNEILGHREAARLKNDTTALANADTGIRKINAEIADAQRKLKEVKDKLSKRDQLIAEEQRAKERKKEIQEDQDKLEPQLDDAEDKLNRARVEADANKSSHAKDEARVAEELRMAIGGGVEDYLSQEITRAEEARTKLIENAKNDKSTEEKNVLDALNTRWDRYVGDRNAVRKWWNPNNREFARDMINADYQNLINAGPDQVVRDMLRASNPGRFINNVAADAWIAANGEAVGRMREQVVETLLTKKIQTGKLTQGDARFIAGSTWGKEAIGKAITNRQDILNKLKELDTAKIMKGNASEWLGEQVRRNPAFWLAIILGTAGLALLPALAAGAGLGLTSAAAATGGGLGGALGLGGAKAAYSV